MADTVVWSIRDGDYPFLDEFPIRYNVEYTSDVLWQILDGNYPYKKSFPQMMGFTDASDNIWIIKDGGYPYKRAFPPMPKPPRIEKRYKGKHSKIIIPIYKQTIPVGKVLRSDPPG